MTIEIFSQYREILQIPDASYSGSLEDIVNQISAILEFNRGDVGTVIDIVNTPNLNDGVLLTEELIGLLALILQSGRITKQTVDVTDPQLVINSGKLYYRVPIVGDVTLIDIGSNGILFS